MTVIAMSKITSKGQVTLPVEVRKLLKLVKGEPVAFCVDKSGVFISRCKVDVQKPRFSQAELDKIERLANARGRVLAGAEEAKRYVKGL